MEEKACCESTGALSPVSVGSPGQLSTRQGASVRYPLGLDQCTARPRQPLHDTRVKGTSCKRSSLSGVRGCGVSGGVAASGAGRPAEGCPSSRSADGKIKSHESQGLKMQSILLTWTSFSRCTYPHSPTQLCAVRPPSPPMSSSIKPPPHPWSASL